MKSGITFLTAIILLSLLFACTQKTEQSDKQEMTVYINDLMKKMTLEEKLGQMNLLPGPGKIVTGLASASEIGKKIQEGKVGGLLNIKSVENIRQVQKVAVEESRLGIPLIFGMDVIHGYRTTFPIPLALAASFDMPLIEQSARIAAVEASADGINWTYSPMVDICRDPRWGRIAEGSGEDVYLGSRVAEAFVRGYQGDNLSKNNTIMACVKHFALYGASEAGRDYNTTDMSRLRMFNEYLPPYQAAIDAGAGSVMTSFNEVDGIPASGNKWLMNDLLRDQWGFDGFVVTDYTAINEMTNHGMGDLQTVSAMSLRAGVDMDMVGEGFLTTLEKSLQEGKVTRAQIDRACRRVLEAKYVLGLFEDPYRYCDADRAKTEIFTEEHNRIAREIATQTFVLLKNENQVLPLALKGKIALVGPLADSQYNMAGMWSVAVDHDESVSVLRGFKDFAGDQAEIFYARGSNITDNPDLDRWSASRGKTTIDTLRSPEQLRAEAVALASKCDVVVAVMGEAAEMTGESASRSDITLPGSQRQLLEALLKTGKPVVLVLFTGRPLAMTWEQENIPAILNVWFGGTQAGPAIADVVFGRVNPSGKLPSTFPQNVGQVPLFYNHKNTGRPLPEGEWFGKYRSNYLDVTNEPLYPFGYGLSYTQFTYGDVELNWKSAVGSRQSAVGSRQSAVGSRQSAVGSRQSAVGSRQSAVGGQELEASITLINSGSYDGAEVVQLYIRDMVGSITRPVKELKGFQKVYLKAGESKTISFTITTEDLKFFNYDLKYDWEPGEFVIMVGGNSRDVKWVEINWAK